MSIKSLSLLLLLAITAGLFFFLLNNWKKLGIYAPQIELIEVPKGIGVAPVNLIMRLSAAPAGLGQVIVSVRQRDKRREVINRELSGQEQETLTLEFPGPSSDLEEGKAAFEVWIKDRSYLGRTAQRQLNLRVDYQRPKLEIMATSESIKLGETRLIIFRAFDEALVLTGVKIGKGFSAAFPATVLDSDLKEDGLLGVLFTAPLDFNGQIVPVRVIAEDSAGNTSSITVNLKVEGREFAKSSFEISGALLRRAVTLFEGNKGLLKTAGQGDLEFKYKQVSDGRLLEQFLWVNDKLRQLNSAKIGRYLSDRGIENRWSGIFERPVGRMQQLFGEQVEFLYSGKPVQAQVQKGMQFFLSANQSEVYALNSGVVVFVDTIGVYGTTVGISHGMGLASVYGLLGNVSVKQGEFVNSGQAIGRVGYSGLSNGSQLLLEMRLNGQEVDPAQWWDQGRFQSSITREVNNVKRRLGLPIKGRVIR